MKLKTSIRGIECEFDNIERLLDYLCFKEICLEQVYFYVVDSIYTSAKKSFVMPRHFLPEYLSVIQKSHAVFDCLVLHIYPIGKAEEEIETYEDFLRSSCEMIVLIYDGYFMEIYSKKQTWLYSLLKTAKNTTGISVRKKTESSDTRTEMFV